MTVWCHLPTIFNRRRALRIAGLLALCVALTTTLFLSVVSHAAPGINQTLSFQGRLLNKTGGVVPDGYYNIQFKIYQDGNESGTGSTEKWVESYVNANDEQGVEVKNGYFSVNLGSKNPFASLVDWNQDTLWLSMNVAGTAANCTTFDSGACDADGEMLPMKRITSTPFSLNSGRLEGKTAAQFLQLAQGVQEDASTNSSIFINKTGTGNLLQLQSTGTDVLSVNNSGDILFGSGSNHSLTVATSPTDVIGNNLLIAAGGGGGYDTDPSGLYGGNLVLQGGSGGGDNGIGGSVIIDGGAATGDSGHNGNIFIGTNNASGIAIGSLSGEVNQQILIGGNDTAGSSTNITIGAGGGASGGSTSIRSKDDTTFTTNGTQRARFAAGSDTLYVGNADSDGQAEIANGFTIQGTSSTGADTQGGSLTLQAGSATNGNANGGNLVLSAGAGSGTGSTGLVVINTPTFQTADNDANCYTGGALVTSSCTFTSASVNSSSVLVAGFSTYDQVATLPDPAITTAGRLIYVTAANGSKSFILRANSGAGDGVEQNVVMRQNTTATMIWNGSDWTTAGSAGGGDLQGVYDNILQTTGNAELVLRQGSDSNGLVITDNRTDPISGALLRVQSATDAQLFSISGNVAEYATNGGGETQGATSSDLQNNTWDYRGADTLSRYTTAGNYVASGQASVRVTSSDAYSGVHNQLRTALTPNSTYDVSMLVKVQSGSLTDLGVYYIPFGSTPSATCTDNVTVSNSEWTRVTCSFTTPASGIVDTNNIAITQASSGAVTYYIDEFSVTQASDAAPSVTIGGGQNSGKTTLFTLDKAASTPTAADSNTLLGSMYYDTTLGKVQCYEADGWGACGAAPDTFITLSPEYANAVMNGSSSGTMSSDICSDLLNINDGSGDPAQPTVCDEDETYNFYKWTSGESTSQTKSIYVTYQLPTNFKNFVSDQTSLMGRVNDTDAGVSYQIYRNNSTNGLTPCGSAVSVTTENAWQKAIATSGNDPANCNFAAGDSIVFRINLSAKDNVNAYISNLNFVFSNQ